MKYILPPQQVFYGNLSKKNCCLAPSKFAIFIPEEKNNLYFEKLSNLIITSKKREKIINNKKYIYIEIGDIDINTGSIEYNESYGVNLPSDTALTLSYEDIIISKVRTYRKGIAIISSNHNHLVGTSAFIVIKDVNNISKYYLYSILRHDFFIEQILSMQNRGMYPRLDNDTEKQVYIPIPKDNNIINYITLLTKSLIRKENEIKNRYLVIDSLIQQELRKNQNKSNFLYNYPTFKEISGEKRVDTGIYTENYKQILHLITNYKHGFFYIPENEFKSGSTPKERIIGKGNNIWVTPTGISKYGFLADCQRILSSRNNINKNCLLLVNRTSKEGLGEYVGISFFYEYNKLGKAHHNQGLYRINSYSDNELKLLASLLNSKIYRKLCGSVSLGSKMKEIKITNFSKIPFPKLEKSVADNIIKLYSHNYPYTENITTENFEENDLLVTSSSGILELSYQIIKIKRQINSIIDKMLEEKATNQGFDFLSIFWYRCDQKRNQSRRLFYKDICTTNGLLVDV